MRTFLTTILLFLAVCVVGCDRLYGDDDDSITVHPTRPPSGQGEVWVIDVTVTYRDGADERSDFEVAAMDVGLDPVDAAIEVRAIVQDKYAGLNITFILGDATADAPNRIELRWGSDRGLVGMGWYDPGNVVANCDCSMLGDPELGTFVNVVSIEWLNMVAWNQSPQPWTELVARVTAHEVGHGLGASPTITRHDTGIMEPSFRTGAGVDGVMFSQLDYDYLSMVLR